MLLFRSWLVDRERFLRGMGNSYNIVGGQWYSQSIKLFLGDMGSMWGIPMKACELFGELLRFEEVLELPESEVEKKEVDHWGQVLRGLLSSPLPVPSLSVARSCDAFLPHLPTITIQVPRAWDQEAMDWTLRNHEPWFQSHKLINSTKPWNSIV